MIGIYKITSPKGRIYIGQSVDIRSRFLSYKRGECKRQSRLYNSFIKYGYINHVFEMIEECTLEQLNERERFWQDHYNVLGRNGLNCRLTVTTDKSGVLSDETKSRISLSNKGKIITEQWRKKLSIATKGRPLTEEHKNKINETKYKKVVDDSTGFIFNSAQEASDKMGIKYTSLISYLNPNNKRSNPTNLKYK